MAKTFRYYNPDQLLLLPPNLREWLPENHLAYFINDIVDELDLSEITLSYEGEERGYPPYHPVMLTKVLLYAYCVGRPSSRKIQKAVEEDVAFRVLAAENRPDFRTISDFRKRHLKALAGIFVQVLKLCQEAGLVKLGHVALDGTKVKANASKHKAMSYERMCKTEQELEDEIRRLLQEGVRIDEQEDRRFGPDKRGDELPEELARRETRLKKIREAKKRLEEEARQQAERKRKEREEKERTAEAAGIKPRGPKPKPIEDTPKAKAQCNFTDSDSKIMKDANKAFIQGYNAQIAVDATAQVIVACDVITNPKDSVNTVALVEQVEQNTGDNPQKITADAGNYSEENVKRFLEQGIDPYIATDKRMHNQPLPTPPRGRIPKNTSTKSRMIRKLRTKKGRETYSRRKEVVEPVFGQIKSARGFERFLFRGHHKVRLEWTLICLGHNILKLFRSGAYAPA